MTVLIKAPDLAKMKELLASETKTGGDMMSSRGAYFPFWSIPTNTTATVRLLPDGDPENSFPWVEKRTIQLLFPGIINSENDTEEEVYATVPCMQTWGKPCYITDSNKSKWRGSDEEKAFAKLYWRKQSFIFQGLIVASPLMEDSPPENPIRRFSFTKTIFETVKAALMDPETEDSPFDPDLGRDFRIQKTTLGQYANYGKCSFSGRVRKISDAERASVEKFGLSRLADELGPMPNEAGIELIKAMYHDSVAGVPFDSRKYAPYRAFSQRRPATSAAVAQASAATTTGAPASASSAAAGDILARLRNRTSA